MRSCTGIKTKKIICANVHSIKNKGIVEINRWRLTADQKSCLIDHCSSSVYSDTHVKRWCTGGTYNGNNIFMCFSSFQF